MLKFSGFHFTRPLFFCSAIVFFSLLAVNASAQTENGKIEDLNPRANDRVILEDHTVIQDNQSSIAPVKAAPNQKSSPAVIRKDYNSGEAINEKELKKTDSPSTLSFNIFLYIVDKFKVD